MSESDAIRDPIRVLYLMHVDWHWVRQRPHALAEELDRRPEMSVLVAYLPNWRRTRLGHNPSPVRRLPIPQLPFGGRLSPVDRINRWLARRFLAVLGRAFRPQVVVIPYPTMYALLPGHLSRLPLVYDCMDLATGFARDASARRELERIERELVAAATGVVASSEFLARTVGARAQVIRNGATRFEPLPDRRSADDDHGSVRLAYFGTVSEWLDFDLLTELLGRDARVEIDMWGPADIAVPAHGRLRWHGVVPHAELRAVVADASALIMPFRLSDLIRGVDPVKLYEYVSLGRPVLSVYYPELEQFRGLVTFFDGPAELAALVEQLRRDPDRLAPDRRRADAFLAASTWQARGDQMAHVVAEAARGRPAQPAPAGSS